MNTCVYVVNIVKVDNSFLFGCTLIESKKKGQKWVLFVTKICIIK